MCETMTFNFTSHCDGEDVLQIKADMNPDKTVLIHGDQAKMEQFISAHQDEGFVIAQNGQKIQL